MRRLGLVALGLLTGAWTPFQCGVTLPARTPSDLSIAISLTETCISANTVSSGELLCMTHADAVNAVLHGQTPEWRHNAAIEHLRHAPGRYCWGDARLIHDTQRNRFIVDPLAWTAPPEIGGVPYGWCIGTGVYDPAGTYDWQWSVVPWVGADDDGARVSVNDTSILLVSVGAGPAHVCNKDYAALGIPFCSLAEVSLANRVPVIAEGGTGGDFVVAGQDESNDQLTLAYVQHPYFNVTVYVPLGPLTIFDQAYVVRSPGRSDPAFGITLKDCVMDRRFNRYWCAFEGPCPRVVNTPQHQCVGAFQIDGIFPPAWLSIYWFDWNADPNIDGLLPSLTVDARGTAWLNWVAQGPTMNPSMAVGTIDPGAPPGWHFLPADIVVRGTGPYPTARNFDFTGIDHVPGHNGAIAYGGNIEQGDGKGHVVTLLQP